MEEEVEVENKFEFSTITIVINTSDTKNTNKEFIWNLINALGDLSSSQNNTYSISIYDIELDSTTSMFKVSLRF